MIVEYKLDAYLHNNQRVITTPAWVLDGGYLQNPANKTMMGFTPSSANREFKVPDSVLQLTVAEAKTRALAIHAIQPYQKKDGNMTFSNMTNAEVETMVQDLITAHDLV